MSNGAHIINIADIVTALGCGERSAWRWVADLPHVRDDETGRFFYTLPDILVSLRRKRREGLSAAAGLRLAQQVSPAAGLVPPGTVCADPGHLREALTGYESITAGHYAAKARNGVLRTLWSAMTPQQKAACAKISLHPAVLCAILGDQSALPRDGAAWDAFATNFAMANADPATQSQETKELENG